MSVNKVILVGRLGRDPETRYTTSGKGVSNVSLATDENFTDGNGEKQKRTEWHRLVFWEKQAEIAQKYLHKGSLVFVEGRIQTREWEDRSGEKKTTQEIVVSNFRMLDPAPKEAAVGGSTTTTTNQTEVFDENSIPF